MVTFLSGGTGTPKLLDGLDGVYPRSETTVIANTGDDLELGGLLVCPDVDTVLFQGGGMLDRETWWGIEDDTTRTHDELRELGAALGVAEGPRYLPESEQTAGRDIANWRRFSAIAEFMEIGDRDRAIHLTRTGLIDEGHTLTEAVSRLADALGVELEVLPMSNDPVATLIETPKRTMHFQEFWVAHGGTPTVRDVEFRGAREATPAPGVLDALAEDVVIGPSNPVTSIGPLLAIDAIEDALEATTVVVVSPFLGDEAFSGPAAKLMDATGIEPSTAGVADAYPFADAFVLDENDPTRLDVPTVRTDIRIDDEEDATRVLRAVETARNEVSDG